MDHQGESIFSSLMWKWRSWEEIKDASWFTKSNYVNIILLIVFVVLAIRQARSKMGEVEEARKSSTFISAPEFPDVEELSNFSYQDEEPLRLRNFKPKYFLTMGLQKLAPSDLLLMDRDYPSRLSYRKRIIKENPNVAIAINGDGTRVVSAVNELYSWLMGTYLPKRFPTMFKLHLTAFETGDQYMLENLVTKEIIPAQGQPTGKDRTKAPITKIKAKSLLQTLGRTIDEDFLILVPEDRDAEKEDAALAKYVLEAAVCVCPSGWSPAEKIGKKLADIHGPVPSYKNVLEGSMDRYFARIEVGDYMKRSNWSIVTEAELFRPGGDTNHAKEGDVVHEMAEIDPEKVFLRCERQTLHRLPKSKALVFAFKTFMHSMKEIKEEGLGHELADAVEGLTAGNAPGMYFYKRGVEWGEAVKRYLRS